MQVFSLEMQTWIGVVVADEPINFVRRDWNKSSSHSSSINIVYSWFMRLAIGIACKPSESTMPCIFRLRITHPFCYWRSDSITPYYNLQNMISNPI